MYRILRFTLLCITVSVCTCESPYAQTVEPAGVNNQNQELKPSARLEISGTVLDTNGTVIEGATVQLSRTGAPATMRQSESGTLGQFAFADLEPGTYVLTVSRKGMSSFISQPITLEPDKPVVLPNVVLAVEAVTTNVTVMDEEAASVQQVRIAEQQRVFKVFPNFYSSFDWNAPPMLTKQKYGLAVRTLIDPVTFLTTAGIAGAEQYENVFPGFGGGIEGFAKRYGASYTNHASAELFTRAVYPSVFHTDPRYFVMGTGTKRQRAFHAIGSTLVTRGDDGKRRVNFPQILGEFSAAALSNAYFPENERGVHLVLINGFADLGGNMFDNLIREFILNHVTTRATH